MLSREENDLLCRVGPGTVMGDFVRQYWIPFLPSRDLPEKDGRPIKVRLRFVGNIQDRAMTEAMGPIYKRWKEHLGSTDAMVIFVRRRLLDAARALREKGAVPANSRNPSLNRVRSASIMLPDGQSWVAATEEARKSDAGAPIAWAPLPV